MDRTHLKGTAVSIQGSCTTRCEPRKHFVHLIVLFALLIAAFGLRCYHLTQPPLDFHPTCQYRSLILSRAHYFENVGSVPEWQQHVARINKQMTFIKEPPIIEYLVAWAYQLVGAEQLWIPRMFSVTFWVLGGLFLYMLTSEMVSPPGASLRPAGLGAAK